MEVLSTSASVDACSIRFFMWIKHIAFKLAKRKDNETVTCCQY